MLASRNRGQGKRKGPRLFVSDWVAFSLVSPHCDLCVSDLTDLKLEKELVRLGLNPSFLDRAP